MFLSLSSLSCPEFQIRRQTVEDDALAMAFTNKRRKLALEAAAGTLPFARVEEL